MNNVFSAGTEFSSVGPLSIGFNFNGYTSFFVSSNGFIGFGATSLGSGNDLNESSSNQRPIIAPLWDILKVGPAGSVDYKVTGVTPNRILTVQFKNMLWDKNAGSPGISFQIKLYETSNQIDFIYKQESGTVSSFYGGATIGITTENTGSGEFISINSAGVPNSSVSINDISTKPPTGTVYRFIKPVFPEVSSLSPSDNGKLFDVKRDLVIGFDRNIQLGASYLAGDISIYNQSDDTVFEEVPPENIRVYGSTAEISHTSDFIPGNNYYVLIGASVFTDGDEFYEGINDSETWNFLISTPAELNDGGTGVFNEDFESLLNDYWTVDGTEHARNQRTTEYTPHGGLYHFLMDSDSRYTPATNYLTLNIDLETAGIWPDLTFWYKDVGENTNNDDGIFISNDNTSWINALPLKPGSYANDVWQELRVDIKKAAQNNAISIGKPFFVQFRHIDNDIVPNRGVAFDDISIVNAPHITAMFPLNGAEVPATDDLTLTFDRIVNLDAGYNTGDITIYDSGDNVFEEVPPGNITGSGTDTITISHTDFADATGYYVVITNRVFKDESDIYFGGISDPSYTNNFGDWFFTATANNPVVIDLEPDDDTIPSDSNVGLALTFNKNILKGAGNIVIYRSSDDSVFRSIDVVSSDVSVSGDTVSIENNNLECGIKYYIQIDSTCFNDGSGNDFAGISDKTTWNLLPSGNCPNIDYIDPPDEGAVSGLNGTLTIYFNQDVTAGPGDIEIYDLSASKIFETIPALDSRISIHNSKVTIDPHGTFFASYLYSVRIDSDAFRSAANNWHFIGIQDDDTWNFTYTYPAVQSLEPSNGGMVSSATADLKIVFDRPMAFNSDGYSTGDLTIKNSGGTVFEDILADNISISPANTVNISHTSDFIPGNDYYVILNNTVFYDADSITAYFTGFNEPPDPNAWEFSMNDAPTVIIHSPQIGGQPSTPDEDLQLTFDRDIFFNAGSYTTGDITVYDDTTPASEAIAAADINVSGNVLTISHTEDFESGHDYHVEIANGIFEDETATPYAGISDSSWYFRRTDHPTATLDPPDDTSPLNTTTPLTLYFDREITVGSGNITIVETGVGDFQVIDVTSANVTGGGSDTITVNHDPFQMDTAYHILIDDSAFTDGAWNYQGISSDSAWNLAPISSTLFRAMDYFPADDTQITDPDANFVITFNLNAAKGSGNIYIYRSDTTIFQQIDVASTDIAISGDQATISHNTLERGISYYVKVDNGTFTQDGDPSNAYEGISDKAAWNLSVKRLPQVTGFEPLDNGKASTPDQALIITFDRNIHVNGSYSDGDITLYNDTDSSSDPISAGDITITDNRATISHPSTLFEAGKSYHVEIGNDVFHDDDSLFFGGISAATTWNFSVSDQPPAVKTLIPPDGGQPDSLVSDLSVTFDTPVYEVAGKNLQIFRYSDDTPVDEYTLSHANVTGSGTSTITIQHADFEYDTRYYVLIENGAFENAFGTAWAGFADKDDWSFTTKPEVLPVSLTFFSAYGITGKIRLWWLTEWENDIASFNVWRSDTRDGTFVKISDPSISAKGDPSTGAFYVYDDASAADGVTYYYRLESVDTNGNTEFISETIASRTPGIEDALAGLKIISGLTVPEQNIRDADITGDGIVDFKDILKILQLLAE